MARYEEITDEPAPAAGGGRYEEVSEGAPKLDPRGREYDPRFAPSAEDDEVELAPSSRQALARRIKNTGSYRDVMDTFAQQGRQTRGEPEPHGLSDIITGKAKRDVSKGESFTRGAVQGASLGFGDEISAAIDTGVSKIPGVRSFADLFQDASLPSLTDSSLSYSQRRQAYREKNKAAEEAHGGYYTAGEVAGGIVTTPVLPGGAAIKLGSKAATMAARGAFAGGVAGAATGLGTSTADLTEGEFGQAFKDAGRGGATGIIVGGALGGAVGKITGGAAEREAAALMKGIASGEGTAGRATVKAAKLLDRAEENAVSVLRENKDLAKMAGKPAKEALPIFDDHLEAVGKKLDPLYEIKDQATGGVSIMNMVNVLDDEMATLARSPLNEQYVKAVQSIKDSVLKSWAPELGEKMAGNAKARAAGLLEGGPVFKNMEDVFVPTKDVRAMVTRLQKRGTEAINALNPGESTQMKADMAKLMKGFLDADLDIAAEQGGKVAKAVEDIRAINKDYSALATMRNAIEQRGWKEATGAISAEGGRASMVKKGGLLAAIPLAMHGNIPAAIGVAAAPYAMPLVKKAGTAANAAIARAQRSDTLMAQTILRLMEAGVPRATALQVARSASTGGALNAMGGALSGSASGE